MGASSHPISRDVDQGVRAANGCRRVAVHKAIQTGRLAESLGKDAQGNIVIADALRAVQEPWPDLGLRD